MDGTLPQAPEPTPVPPRNALDPWWIQGLRSALLLRVDWRPLRATPLVVVMLWLVLELAGMVIQRWAIDGPATFYAPALLSSGWLMLVLWLFLGWCLVRGDAAVPPAVQPVTLAALLSAQCLFQVLAMGLVLVPLARSGAFGPDTAWLPPWAGESLWVLGLLWMWLAQSLVLWRVSRQPRARRVAVVLALAAATVLVNVYTPLRHWYPAPSQDTEEVGPPGFRLTQELVEAQGQVLARDLQALLPQRRDRIDVYTVVYAPYADEDVFLRESEMVADVMRDRFDGAGRVLQLVSRYDAEPSKAWATPLNLERSLQRVAALMDRDEDLLVLHLSSHGARDGQLASSMGPLEVDALTPVRLKALLDAAGIRHRVVSVSACYSGSWIEPLAAEHTLVMTAADATNTSYGCGRRSPLTFFGRAVFDEQLRRATLSFEEAHAAARPVIEQREKEAGKTDGYSNPQIAVGPAIRAQLDRLVEQLGRR